ncbi:SLAM family member 9-like [Xyrauchen texanus]|uniref:SLAM family member 9-like n=1 Tax=Xyrauchen texanus TaxID=154827 RepID=UPI00224244E5|nr:SLAM family member 9-like [Xyrauchen texanus]
MNNVSHIAFIVFVLVACGVFGVDPDKVKSVSVMEGDSVTLHTDLTQIQDKDEIEWRFGSENIRIARIKRKIFSTSDDVLDGRFRGRLHLNHQTGDLTITNITTEHTGLYQRIVTTENKDTTKTFNVTVSARLPVPVIISDSSLNSSSSESSSKCVLVCSVVNVTQATLSWYKGNSLLSSISVSDLNRSLSLHLECADDSYSCVINNPIRNQTKHLNNTEVCQTCSGPDKESPSQPQNSSLIMWISAAAAGILFIAAVLMIFIYRKHRITDQEDQTRAGEIVYADPTLFKRAQKPIVHQEDDVVYAGVAVRH